MDLGVPGEITRFKAAVTFLDGRNRSANSSGHFLGYFSTTVKIRHLMPI